mmetsp:Transcript_11897/g.35609  ORF Transcript_11897/g.35609 Transcript_11897/m.35609 type:complete len:211 (-) Transcript_11897:21-653(-)
MGTTGGVRLRAAGDARTGRCSATGRCWKRMACSRTLPWPSVGAATAARHHRSSAGTPVRRRRRKVRRHESSSASPVSAAAAGAGAGASEAAAGDPADAVVRRAAWANIVKAATQPSGPAAPVAAAAPAPEPPGSPASSEIRQPVVSWRAVTHMPPLRATRRPLPRGNHSLLPAESSDRMCPCCRPAGTALKSGGLTLLSTFPQQMRRASI